MLAHPAWCNNCSEVESELLFKCCLNVHFAKALLLPGFRLPTGQTRMEPRATSPASWAVLVWSRQAQISWHLVFDNFRSHHVDRRPFTCHATLCKHGARKSSSQDEAFRADDSCQLVCFQPKDMLFLPAKVHVRCCAYVNIRGNDESVLRMRSLLKAYSLNGINIILFMIIIQIANLSQQFWNFISIFIFLSFFYFLKCI